MPTCWMCSGSMASCLMVIKLHSYLVGWFGKKENISYIMVSTWQHIKNKTGMFWNKSIYPSVGFPPPCSVHYDYTKFAERKFNLECCHEYLINSRPWYSPYNFHCVFSPTFEMGASWTYYIYFGFFFQSTFYILWGGGVLR